MEFLRRVETAAHVLGAIILGLVVLAIVSNVVVRAFGGCMLWVEELSGYAVIWGVYLGGAYTLREGRHVKVDLVSEKLGVRGEAVMRLAGDIASLIFGAVITWKGAYLLGVAQQAQRHTPLLELPVYILMIVLPVGMALFTLEAVADAVVAVGLLRAGQRPKKFT
ncbi:MAG: hypothetical protein VR68_13210 [Peptococcaceae bacterium BRH_c4a]|nr:MAG: hypothetical protein VR68_13210 [Peptococcaceae bacterium BRH_c4a]